MTLENLVVIGIVMVKSRESLPEEKAVQMMQGRIMFLQE